MKLISYSEIRGPYNEYAWTIIFQFKIDIPIKNSKNLLESIINTKILNHYFYRDTKNKNLLCNVLTRPIPFYKIKIEDFEFITTIERLKEVFYTKYNEFTDCIELGENYNSEVFSILRDNLNENQGIWHISSIDFEDELENNFNKAGIETELFVAINIDNQTVTTLDYGFD